jgi:hypothetical protein
MMNDGLGVLNYALAPFGALGMCYDIPVLIAVDPSHEYF